MRNSRADASASREKSLPCEKLVFARIRRTHRDAKQTSRDALAQLRLNNMTVNKVLCHRHFFIVAKTARCAEVFAKTKRARDDFPNASHEQRRAGALLAHTFP
jgi:hypothetical protein